MQNKETIFAVISEQGIVPLYYHDDPDICIRLLKALYEGGMRTMEFADRGALALKNFSEMRRVCDRELPDMHLGIGTIKNVQAAQAYIDAGAEFIVCPGMLESVVALADRYKLLAIPGCMTPTELVQAASLTVPIVKLFPANSLGPPFLDAVQAVFSELLFMPTGGIEIERDNLTAWFKRRVCAVGGSKLITGEIIANQDYDRLTEQASRALDLIRSVRNSLR